MKKENVKEFFKSITIFEIIWVISVFVISILAVIFFPDLMLEDKTNIIIVICSVISIIASPICELLISKQCRYWTLFSLVFVEITDIVVLVYMGLYSSACLSLFFWIPLDIVTYFRWGGKNKDEYQKSKTKVKKLNWWQDIIVICSMIATSVVLGFILKFIQGREINFVVAFSNVFEIANGAFLLLRFREQWFAWFGYLICETVIWISLGHPIMLITVFAMMINTIYGFIKWTLYVKSKQNKKEVASF